MSTDHVSEAILLPTVAVCRQDGGGPVKLSDSWQAYLAEVAYHLRAAVEADPDVLRLLTMSPRAAWWLQPAVGDLVLVEEFLTSMKRYGFIDEDAASVYLAFFTRLLGLLHVQAARSPVPYIGAVNDLSAYPNLLRLRPWLSHNNDRGDFDAALDDLLTTLERDLRK